MKNIIINEKINIFGTGKRFKNYILDIIIHYINENENKIKITGICNKSGVLDHIIMNKLNINKILYSLKDFYYDLVLSNTNDIKLL